MEQLNRKPISVGGVEFAWGARFSC